MNLFGVEQLAELSNESVAVWRKRIFRREIPFVKMGRNVRVKEVDFESWVNSRLVADRADSAAQGQQP